MINTNICPVSVFIRSCCVFKPHPKLQLPLWILHKTHGTHIKEKSLDPRDPSIWIGNICICFFYCLDHTFCCLFFRNNQQLFNRKATKDKYLGLLSVLCQINGWRVHKIYLVTGHFLLLHIFRYFKPRQTVIGLQYDIEKMNYSLCKLGHKSQYVFELFNYSHLNLVLACLVWYCVFVMLTCDILDCTLIKSDTFSSACMSSIKFKLDLVYELCYNEKREKPEPKKQQIQNRREQ